MNSKAAVLQVCPALTEGGVERSTVEMALFQTTKNVIPHVAAHKGPFADTLAENGVTVHDLPFHKKNPFHLVHNAVKLASIIRKHDIRLVHVRSRGPAWSTRWACCWTGVPFITTFHGTYGTRGFLKKFYNRVMLSGEAVIANSTFIRDHISTEYGINTQNIPIAPRGYDPKFFDPQNIQPKELATLRSSLNIKEGDPVILMVGRVTRWKGQHVLLEALAQIKHKPWTALFAGGYSNQPAYFKELTNLIEHYGLQERVQFLGSRTDLPLLYKLADVGISASIEPEAFGRVAIETQAMETPIIATAHGGSLETVQDGITGWLIPPNNSTVLAETLGEALTNPKNLAKMGQQACIWVAQHFTVQQTCEKEWTVYERILGTHHKKP